MVVRLYAVYDRVTEEYSPVSEAVNDGTAQRMFNDALKDHPHKADFTVMHVATFNKTTGEIKPAKPRILEPGQLELDVAPKEAASA